jgi:hypothetical protein
MNTTLLLVSVASLSVTSAFAQTDSARELKQLAEQRDASVAAAIAPINRKYTDSLKMLLGKATRAGDLDTALKVRTELEKYGVKVARNGDMKDESSHSPELRAALLATTWSWSENPDKKGVECRGAIKTRKHCAIKSRKVMG